MNYLAHAYLTFPDELPTFGNLIADFVKGRHRLDLPAPIQYGIQIHRFIDRYTDKHPLVHEAQNYFRKANPLAAGIFTDIFFDHFLANHPEYFDDISLIQFTDEIYQLLLKHRTIMDDRMLMFFTHMAQYNWLYSYKSAEGIEKSVRGICRRYPRLGNPDQALELFMIHYDQLALCFDEFFPELMKACKEEFDESTKPFKLN